MVFVKFHNMNRKKNSNVAFKLKQTQRVSLYNKSKQYYNHSSKNVQFSFLLFFQSMFCLFKKNVCSFFLFFFICCVQQYSSVFSFFFSFFFPSSLSCSFLFFLFFSILIFFSFFFIHNKLLIQCLFFFLTLSLPLSVLTLIL